MRGTTVGVVAVLAIGFAPAPFPKSERASSDPVARDLKKMQGRWKYARYLLGEDSFPCKGREVTMVGSRLTILNEGRVMSRWSIILLPNEQPKALRIKRDRAVSGPPEEAVYAVEGNKLTLCYPAGGLKDSEVRPAALAPDRRRIYLVLERANDAD